MFKCKFITLRDKKYSKIAKENLKHVASLLKNVDEGLANIAIETVLPLEKDNVDSEIPKKKNKRKLEKDDHTFEDMDSTHVPKKRGKKGASSKPSGSLTLSQREENAMKELQKHIGECGGK